MLEKFNLDVEGSLQPLHQRVTYKRLTKFYSKRRCQDVTQFNSLEVLQKFKAQPKANFIIIASRFLFNVCPVQRKTLRSASDEA